jgi:hypothetical protein
MKVAHTSSINIHQCAVLILELPSAMLRLIAPSKSVFLNHPDPRHAHLTIVVASSHCRSNVLFALLELSLTKAWSVYIHKTRMSLLLQLSRIIVRIVIVH